MSPSSRKSLVFFFLFSPGFYLRREIGASEEVVYFGDWSIEAARTFPEGIRSRNNKYFCSLYSAFSYPSIFNSYQVSSVEKDIIEA